jgi:hypothetical protein
MGSLDAHASCDSIFLYCKEISNIVIDVKGNNTQVVINIKVVIYKS